MKKKYIKTAIIITAFLLLLSAKEAFAATGGYQFENTAFYAQASSLGYVYENIAFYSFDTQVTDSLPVYLFSNTINGDHFYTISENEKNAVINNPQWGYVYEKIAFYAFSAKTVDSLPAYRFVNSNTNDHFYTISESEKDTIINNPQWGYIAEGIAFYALNSQTTDSLPVYRFLNSTTGDHFYTISESEKDNISISPVYRFVNLNNGDHFYTISVNEKNSILGNPQWAYVYEGVGFYAHSRQITNSLPVYRFLNSTTGDHFYTLSEAENNLLINNPQWGYIAEGIVFYAFPTQINNSLPVYRFYNATSGDHFYTISEAEKNYLLLPNLGPEISVGLWAYNSTDLKSTSTFKVEANKDYVIKNSSGTVIATVSGATVTKTNYVSNQNFKVTSSIPETLVNKEVSFEAADGDNTSMIFDIYRPNSTYDQYRGKVKIRYTDSNNIWVINTLPMEHYIWGEGETTGTGNINHTKVMTTIFRTYGYWYVKYATKYAPFGFKIRSDSGSQIYAGYDWEIAHPNIKIAAEANRGTIASYANDVALTPYSSWTDGRTRSFQERWGSTQYPWCQSVPDPYGKHATMTTAQLEAAGNHMVGLSANGSVNLAANYGWDWEKIMKYYYTGIGLVPAY